MRKPASLCCLIALVVAPLNRCRAQALTDYVVLQTPGRTGKLAMKCLITEYTGRHIEFRVANGGTRRFPSSHVVTVRTLQSPAHAKGLQLLMAGKYDAAVSSFESALTSEDRKWVRREILSLMVRSHRKRGDLLAAGTRFLAILKSDKYTLHFDTIPLVWSPRKIAPALKAQAKLWLFESNNAAKLIAACLLLRDPMYGKTATETLEGLRVTADVRINSLARAQLWRLRLSKGTPDASEVKVWKKIAESLPGKLRAGPYYLIGRGFRARKEHEQAAAAFLWVPLVFDDDPHLAARSCLAAADALSEAGQTREAVTLYREVQQRYSKTEFAQEAAEQERGLTATRTKK